MKKSLIALAALAASSAFAQSSVTLYGIVDVALHKDKGESAALISGGASTSRFGFKGSEDLGGGLKANFQLEQGFNATSGAAGETDTGATAAFGRQAWVGLSGGFGEVQVGKVWTAFDDVWGGANALWDANALTPLKQVSILQNYSDNPEQGLRYTSPSFAGFTAAVSYSLDGSKAVKGNVSAFNVSYANGPVAVALGYQQDHQFASSLAAPTAKVKLTTLNGSYDFGVAKVMAGYTQGKEDGVAGKVKEYTIGVDFPVSSNLILSAGYASSKEDGFSSSTGYSIGAAYLLSKRTTAYAGFFNANATAVADRGAADSRVAVGIKHAF